MIVIEDGNFYIIGENINKKLKLNDWFIILYINNYVY